MVEGLLAQLDQWKSESESRSVMSNSLRPHGLYSPWNSPGQNTRMGSPSIFQGIFPTQGSNQGLLHCRRILCQLSHKGRPSWFTFWSLYLFSLLKQAKRNRIGHKCLYSHIYSLPMYIPHLLCIRDWRRNGVHSNETSRTIVVKLKIWCQGQQQQLQEINLGPHDHVWALPKQNR